MRAHVYMWFVCFCDTFFPCRAAPAWVGQSTGDTVAWGDDLAARTSYGFGEPASPIAGIDQGSVGVGFDQEWTPVAVPVYNEWSGGREGEEEFDFLDTGAAGASAATADAGPDLKAFVTDAADGGEFDLSFGTPRPDVASSGLGMRGSAGWGYASEIKVDPVLNHADIQENEDAAPAEHGSKGRGFDVRVEDVVADDALRVQESEEDDEDDVQWA